MNFLIWVVTFVLAMAIVFSSVFMVVALAMSLWAGVFWYGVSTMFFGAIFRGWIHWRS